MIDRATFSPLVFFEYDHKPGTFCLILSDSHMVAHDDVFGEFGQYSNGYGWEDVARSALCARAPELAGRLNCDLNFDSEAGMFCAYGEDVDVLKVLGQLLQEAWRDRALLKEYIA
ncbi:immunity 51 family protein [Streptomyces sp. NPDC001142]